MERSTKTLLIASLVAVAVAWAVNWWMDFKFGSVLESSIYTFIFLAAVGVPISLKKLVDQAEAKARICPSCGKPRLVWPDCYTCVNPGCERFVAGLVDSEDGIGN